MQGPEFTEAAAANAVNFVGRQHVRNLMIGHQGFTVTEDDHREVELLAGYGLKAVAELDCRLSLVKQNEVGLVVANRAAHAAHFVDGSMATDVAQPMEGRGQRGGAVGIDTEVQCRECITVHYCWLLLHTSGRGFVLFGAPCTIPPSTNKL